MWRLPSPRFASQRAAALLVAWAAVVAADEGMWPFNGLPTETLAQRHGVRLTPEWLERLQQSSVRFNSGGSGSFVSADGLVLTNHHVGADSLQKLSDATHDYFRNGFAAATRADELKCPDLELNVLMSIEDVTARVEAAVTPGMSAADAFAARRAVMAAVEQESLAASGLRSDVVTLYQGGAYHLYRSKKYTDVRLVFAPEQQIAFFGGDADNFEFPRFALDICFFRAYENGNPARVPHHLPWAVRPVAAGDLVFVSGHPGHTDRAATLTELTSMRDVRIPADLQQLNRLESLLAAYAAEGPEEQRQAADDLFGVRNGRKSRLGMQAGLLDPRIIGRRRATEERLRSEIDATLAGKQSPYDRIATAQRELDDIAVRLRLLEGATAFNSRFFAHARTILRSAAERAKPNGERLREYRDSNRESLELGLFSAEPLYDAYETAKLADSLTHLAATLGGDDPLVQQVLAGRAPRERAEELVRGTTLGHRGAAAPAADRLSDTRRALYDGGQAAIAASQDPMLALARLIDDESRRLRKIAEAAQEVKRQAHAEITRARFVRDGVAMYPDATFTLRLAWGTVKAYEESGNTVEPITTFAGLFARATAKRDTPPFDLPPRWQAERRGLEQDATFMATPFNFASTADIIGGNSGSPVVNRAGELVGVIFDGNIQSLVLGIAYDDTQARAVSVDAAGIRAALARVYRADSLLDELGLAAGKGKSLK
ncbi:MAG: S46 family peptidase [Pirellulales bacterium]